MKNQPIPKNINRVALGQKVEYVDDFDGKRYMVVYEEDHDGFGVDVEGNITLALTEENAKEIKRLAEDIINDLNG